MGLPPKVPHHGTASRARQGPAAVPAMQGLCRVVPLPWQAGCLDGAATDRWAGPLRNGPASAGGVGPPSIAGWGLPSTAGPGLSETARPALPGWGLRSGTPSALTVGLDRWAGPFRNGPASAAWVGAALDRWAGPLRNGPASAAWVGPPSIAGWRQPSTAGPGLSETARPALPGWGLPLDRWAGPLRNGPASAAWVGPPLGHPACPRARPRPLGLASPKRPGLRCLGGGSPRRPFALAASLPCGGLRPPAAGPLDKPCCVGPIFGKEAPL